MKRKQFSKEQIIGILKEAEAGAVVTDLCRRHGMSSATYYAWKAKFGGLEVSIKPRSKSRCRRREGTVASHGQPVVLSHSARPGPWPEPPPWPNRVCRAARCPS